MLAPSDGPALEAHLAAVVVHLQRVAVGLPRPGKEKEKSIAKDKGI